MSNKLQEIKKLLKKENMLEKQKKKFNDGHNKNNSNMKSLYLRFLILWCKPNKKKIKKYFYSWAILLIQSHKVSVEVIIKIFF